MNPHTQKNIINSTLKTRTQPKLMFSACLKKCCFIFSPITGLTYTVNWEADENGFRPDAPHLPQPVAIPFPEVAEAVEAQLRFAATQPAFVEEPTTSA